MITALIAIISSLITYSLNKFVDKYLWTPRIKIVFIDTFEHQGMFEVGARHFHQTNLTVLNENIYVAKNCRIYLTRQSVRSRLGIPFLESKVHGQLGWANSSEADKYKPFDLVKGVEIDFELFGSSYFAPGGNPSLKPANYDKLCFRTNRSTKMVDVYSKTSVHELSIIATAENCERYTLEVAVEVSFEEQPPRIRILNQKGSSGSKLLDLVQATKEDMLSTKVELGLTGSSRR